MGNGQALYEMYPQKFMKQTWGFCMTQAGGAEFMPDADYPVSEFTGLSLMALLADCCAGESLRGAGHGSNPGLCGIDERLYKPRR